MVLPTAISTAPKALIVGITGQTGAYLAKLLVENGYQITGSSRERKSANVGNLLAVGLDISSIDIISLNPSDARDVFGLLGSCHYDFIFNLAGQTSVGLSFSQPAQALESISTACLNFLEAMRAFGLKSKYFNAASAECFGNTSTEAADEETPFRPNSPYAIAKASAFHLTRLAREAYGLKAISGILSNHESPLRGEGFVTSKIISDLEKIKRGALNSLVLGNLWTIRDWGFAPDYARAILMMMQSDRCTDYIIATGRSTSLKTLIDLAAEFMGLEDSLVIDQDSSLIRPLDVTESRLNPKKINTELGWRCSVSFEELVFKLVNKLYY